MISFKVVSQFCVIIGSYSGISFAFLPKVVQNRSILFIGNSPVRSNMADSLHKAIHSMSLEEEVPLTLPNDPRFRVFDENATSLLGCLLNPDCQSMSRMIDYMPTAWRVHGRVRGIALSRERFQFIFQREEDLLTVLKDRPWSYNHWAMVMERWTLNPPPDFLQTMQLWTRIRHIPINFYTSETMWKLAAEVGHMEEVAYDPKISQTKDYIRALVTFNTENPAKASRKLDTGGEIVTIEFEYEKLHKRCFHCLRLPHEKLRCPLLRKNQNRGLAKTGEGGPSLSIQVATPKEVSVKTGYARGASGVPSSIPRTPDQ
ncbi:uncharacterized protein LOC106422096 [Brassica napus]|uniref:uncharacterized protein LOC106314641 n=1 Tax=Brassica oleracea var. oleracea TaxID=109376 RepID=UPI0006A6F04F|nr:PREDICTED: uncharacterized protein LOC106314641 [Brassica oleracea var. oleracea]XP_013718380.1 uncharacterized protein LOC106422096 [Brassica napus]